MRGFVTGLVVLAVLAGVGTWNYQRNLAAEAAETFRPYQNLSDDELHALIGAYTDEKAIARQAFDAASLARPARSGGLVGEQVREFERVQRASRNKRALGARVLAHDGELARLEEELEQRTGKVSVELFLRRLFTIRTG